VTVIDKWVLSTTNMDTAYWLSLSHSLSISLCLPPSIYLPDIYIRAVVQYLTNSLHIQHWQCGYYTVGRVYTHLNILFTDLRLLLKANKCCRYQRSCLADSSCVLSCPVPPYQSINRSIDWSIFWWIRWTKFSSLAFHLPRYRRRRAQTDCHVAASGNDDCRHCYRYWRQYWGWW